MKILHLATHDNFGGAARASYRQHLALLAAGVDSKMLVRHKASSDPAANVFAGKRDWFHRINRTIRRSWIARLEQQSRAKGTSGLTDPRADLLREATPDMAEADVINLHKTERFADTTTLLAALPPEKPMVITMHDISPVTGGCDYPGGCERFFNSCGCCPLLANAGERDYSRKIFQWRRLAYATREAKHFAFVANSHWTRRMAVSSGLASASRVEVIHYGLDHSVYSPQRRAEARAAFGIGAEEKVIAFAAHDLKAKHKGGHLLQEALRQLPLSGTVRLLTMGAGYLDAGAQFHHKHFGRIESDELQTLMYRAADVFIIPSLEEAFGQTALEAVACGALVAGFAVGGIVDIVQNGVNGQLVLKGDVPALAQAISSLLENREMQASWQANALKWTHSNFSYAKNAASYLALYQSLLKG
jgi:glycosyltransferase involved in cell wall biosynthesis